MSVVKSYDPIARDYCEKTVSVDRIETRDRFVKFLREGDHILDAGCGSGCDTKAFLNMGFDVTAIDGSKEMVKFASSYTGWPIKHMMFEEMEFENEFDALWASYSLVHYGPLELKEMMYRFLKMLKNGGYWYLSFIYGENEKPKAIIPFYPKTESALQALLNHFPQLEVKEMWVTTGTRRDGNPSEFLHCIVQKVEFFSNSNKVYSLNQTN